MDNLNLWISIDGAKYSCKYGEHMKCAIDICERYYTGRYEDTNMNPVEFLLDKGYIQISNSLAMISIYRNPSLVQKEFLLENEIKLEYIP